MNTSWLENKYINSCCYILVFVLFIIVIILLMKREPKQITSPVEESKIEIIEKANTKLIIEVELLDSIKDVEKDKALVLDNDSTLRLFYELLRKE